jgi:glutamate-1-semialdehyde 2,1-aminomutase
MNSSVAWYIAAAIVAVLVAAWFARMWWARLQLSRAKHPSLAGHSKMSRRVARLVPFYEYDETRFYCADAAPADIVQLRTNGFAALTALFAARFQQSAAASAQIEPGISDLQFTSRYRVPFQFSRVVRERLRGGSFLRASSGTQVTDLDGNVLYDLTGSYGVNVFGYDFYKTCIDRGSAKVRDLGPVLGAYHPLMIDILVQLRRISALDEVSFHMSGTEAVMQAVRLARYHTGRKFLVRFCGAYHGWWGDVQPGVGNPIAANETYTLREMADITLQVLRSRSDIACVLVNPLQALHPNAGAHGDSALVDSSRAAHFDRTAYSEWLWKLRAVCTEKNIVLIFDEVFVGFRLAPGGAQAYFGVRADMVTYGKTLGGGLPVGVLCGLSRYMKRFRADAPADICFARGTFNSHPYVLGAMHEFLSQLQTPQIAALYEGLDETWNARARSLNQRLEQAGANARVVNLSSIWTVTYMRPCVYNWMFQFYLRAQGLHLSWVGTGRLIFSLNFNQEEFEEVAARFITAAAAMQTDGWWWSEPGATNKSIRRRLLGEMLQARWA